MSLPTITVRAELRLRNAKMINARKAYGLSQAAFGALVGMPLTQVMALERLDYSRESTRRYAEKVAAFLELQLSDILPEGVEEALPSGLVVERKMEVRALLASVANFNNRMLLPAPDAVAEHAELQGILLGSLDTLSSREKTALTLRYGLDGEGTRTLDETGRVLHVTRERVRQIERKAITKLQHPARQRSTRLIELQTTAEREDNE